MSKKKIFNCVYLEVALAKPGFGTLTPKDWFSAAQDVVDEIKRHVDGVSHIDIETDIDEVCEFCGYNWTEADNLYNGGCCDEDESQNEERRVP